MTVIVIVIMMIIADNTQTTTLTTTTTTNNNNENDNKNATDNHTIILLGHARGVGGDAQLPRRPRARERLRGPGRGRARRHGHARHLRPHLLPHQRHGVLRAQRLVHGGAGSIHVHVVYTLYTATTSFCLLLLLAS